MAMRLECGDVVTFDDHRWKVVAFNRRNRHAIFVRPDPETNRDIRRCLQVAGLELLDPVTLACVARLEPLQRGLDPALRI